MNNANKKFKKPKQMTTSTTNPETTKQRVNEDTAKASQDLKKPLCALAAKDSEWVDILQTSSADPSTNISDEEEVLQLVECEDGPQMKPLAILFPGLLEKDPVTLRGMLNKEMSTTEVTRHLVNLGEKANFTFMKTADRLISRDKQWLESLTENSNSYTSMASSIYNGSLSSNYDADNEAMCSIRNIEKYTIKNGKEKQARKDGNIITEEKLIAKMREIILEIIQENLPSTHS